jgi:CHAT domain-containing protein/Flp pilus assembly protein TadD
MKNDSGIVALALDLCSLQWHHLNNSSASVEYLIMAADHLSNGRAAENKDDVQSVVLARLIQQAEALYYDLKDAPSAVRLARRATELAPDEPAPWQLLGHAWGSLKKYEAAAQAFEHLTTLDPDEKLSSRANVAVAWVKAGRNKEAMAAANQSLRLRPGCVRPLVLRAQLRERAGDLDGAIADCEASIAILEADRPVGDEDDAAKRQAYREHWSMWAGAYHQLVSIHRQRNDPTALSVTIERLKNAGDDALSAMGYRLAGDLARDAGRPDEAWREYTKALEAFELDVISRKARALLAAQVGDADAAIEDLARLTPRDADPRAAIEALQEVATHFPADRRVQRWLGFAHFEVGAFETAEQNLDAYLNENATDVEARKWLGLSLISVSPDDKHSLQKAGERCFRGLDELARAASQGDAESRQSLLWVIDRLLLKFGFLEIHLANDRPVLDALPGLEDLILRLAPTLMGHRDYEERVRAFSECIPLVNQFGLPCYAAFLYALLGDIEILIGHLQSAVEHARQAQQLPALVFVPRSANLRPQHESIKHDYFGNVTIEREHRHIYDKAAEALTIVKKVSARIAAISGQTEKAHDTVGDIDQILSYVRTIPVSEAIPTVQTLRDAGRVDDALLVLDRIEQESRFPLNDEDRGSVILARATVLGAGGRLVEAIEAARDALPLIEADRRWVAWINIASWAETAGLYTEALEVLDTIDMDRVARSDRDRFMYYYLRAAALEGCGRLREAFEAAQRAIDLLEAQRGGLKDIELRSSWAKLTAPAYKLAVRIAAAQGQARAAFDLTERSRSRLFVDELAMAGGVADEETQQLRQQIRDVEEQSEILQALGTGSEQLLLRADALVRLRQLNSRLKFLQLDEKGVEHISVEALRRAQLQAKGVLERQRDELAEHRVRTAQRLFGDVVGYEACRDLLSEHGRVVLIELVVQDKDTLAFLVKSGRDEPHMVRTLQHIDASAWTRDVIQRLASLRSGDQLSTIDYTPLSELLELIEKETAEEDVLCIVPHGPLHVFPFHALRLGGSYLIERNPVAYAPSASVLAQVLRREDEHALNGAIVLGDTRGDLPYAAREAETVGRLLNVNPLPEAESTRRRLRTLLASAGALRILHFACHGYFDPEDALSSGILTSDDDDRGKPGVLSARDLLEVNLHTDLVALSACQSGLNEVTPGDELMGLNRALLVGGTRSVLGSLWRVDDLSTSFLMRFFYQGWLTGGLSKVQALRGAQRRVMSLTRREVEAAIENKKIVSVRDLHAPGMRRAATVTPQDRMFAPPAHWAAFTLVGDWH